MFDFFGEHFSGFGTRVSTQLAQALIDYKNFTPLAVSSVDITSEGIEANKRYIKDSGTSPKYPLAMLSGQGKYFTIDQYLDGFTIPIGAVSMMYIKDGVPTYTETLIDFGATVPTGWYKDVYYYNRVLTQAEITKNYQYPEQFYFDAINDASCIEAVPMSDNDFYVRGKDYSEGSELVDAVSSTAIWSDASGNYLKNSGTSFDLEVTTVGTNTARPIVFMSTMGSDIGVYELNFNAIITSGTSRLTLFYDGGSISEDYMIKDGENSIVISTLTDSSALLNMYFDGTVEFDISVTDISLKQLSGIYEIQNPTDSLNDNASNLPYGTQSIKMVSDDFGRYLSYSPYYEMNGNQVPAMSLAMTDEQLGAKFVFDFVIERSLELDYAFLLFSGYFEENKGLRLYSNYNGDVRLRLEDGSGSTAIVSSNIDENTHHIIFEVEETTMTMIVDGVAEAPVAHSFVPSGLNFKDSTRASPIGTLKHFKIYDEANYDKYDRQKSIDYVINKGLLT